MERSTYLAIGIFLVIIVTGLFLFNYSREVLVTVDARWFEFNPSEVRVKQGDIVTIKVNNLDVIHGITIPELGVSGNEVLTFKAGKSREFLFYCNNFCGVNHEDMVGKLIVE